MEKRNTGIVKTGGTRVVPGTEFIVNFGDTVRATCGFDYSGPSQNFTFAIEIGTWVGPAGPFNSVNRWETRNIYVTPGTGKQQIITFVVSQVSGLNRGTLYDLNWEIGTGSQQDGTWQLLERLITDDVIKISDLALVFSNLSVAYVKA